MVVAVEKETVGSRNIPEVKLAGLCERQDVIVPSLGGLVGTEANEHSMNLPLKTENTRSGLGKHY